VDNRSIGIFDSGVGGISVLNKLLKLLPNENYVYIGDTVRMPYGIRDIDDIRKHSKQCIEFISRENLKAVVIACNTVSSCAIDNLRDSYDFPIIDVVTPGSRDAVTVTRNNKIAVVATDATVHSGLYNRYIQNLNPEIEVRAVACSDLVLTIETGHAFDDLGKQVIKKYLDEFGDFDYDTLVFGCTHYPLARANFKKIFKEEKRDVFLVDPAHNTALELMDTLKKLNAFNDNNNEGQIKFFTTSDPERFEKLVHDHSTLAENKIKARQVYVDDIFDI
jgi:glutamate racemase